MNLRDLYADLRTEEHRLVPPFGAPASRRLAWRRPAAAFVVVLLIIFFVRRPRPAAFTSEDRAAARAIAAWHPPTDTLLHMPTTGVPR